MGDREVDRIIFTRGDCAENDPRLDELRAKLHQDYDGKVLRKEVIPDPPERGQYGMAYIPLKPDAQPKRQKLYVFLGKKKKL